MAASATEHGDAPVSDRSLRQFFALTFVLATPFWILGAASGVMLLPGLPIAALMTVCPAAAALILTAREGKAGALLARAVDWRRIPAKAWLLVALLTPVAIKTVSFFVLRMAGTAVPAPRIAILPSLILFLVFLVAALGEEIGWSGYATDPLRRRFGALGGGLILGAIWAVFHFVPLAQAHRSLGWVAWWSLGAVATRVILVWLYANTGRSVFAAALYHAVVNLSWQLFPVHGSFEDPRVTGPVTALVAILIVAVWGPRTLTRNRRTPA
jgi:hypothetical protein